MFILCSELWKVVVFVFGGGFLRRCFGLVSVLFLVIVVVPSDRAGAAGDAGSFDVDPVTPAFSGDGEYRWVGTEPRTGGIWVASEDYCLDGFDTFLIRAGDEVESVKSSCFEDGLIDGDEEWHGLVKGNYEQQMFGCANRHFAPVNAVAVRAADRIDALAFGCVDQDEDLNFKQNAANARDLLESKLHGGNGGDLYGMICKNPDHVIVQLRFYSSPDDVVGLGDIGCGLPAQNE